jgi:hypothetical protein
MNKLIFFTLFFTSLITACTKDASRDVLQIPESDQKLGCVAAETGALRFDPKPLVSQKTTYKKIGATSTLSATFNKLSGTNARVSLVFERTGSVYRKFTLSEIQVANNVLVPMSKFTSVIWHTGGVIYSTIKVLSGKISTEQVSGVCKRKLTMKLQIVGYTTETINVTAYMV